ncbi:MAG: hypothetical protein KJ906_03405, partial [Nanoarchaeota archaeon]|nr:hypothetical protein [Nanoarchaeota archaeon]
TVNAGCNVTLTSSHTMTDDLTCANTAFYIGDNNVVLDCAGYTITYGTGGTTQTRGVDNTGSYNNLTVRDCIIIEGIATGNDKDAIYTPSTINSTVHNNTLITVGQSSNGITTIVSSAYNNFTNNTITTSGASGSGILLASDTSNVIGNVVHTNGTTAVGIDVGSLSNSIVMSNNITAEGFGIRLLSSTSVNLSLNNINTTGAGANAIHVIGNSDNNLIYNNNIIQCAANATEIKNLATTFPNNNNLSGNTFSNVAGFDISLGNGVNTTHLIDQSATNYSFNGNSKINFINSSVGEIIYLEAISGSGENLNADVKININYTYINSSKAGLNKSANLTFFGVTGITNAIPMRDGIGCSPSICSNVTNSTATTFHFNVTSFSYYSVNHNVTSNEPTIDYVSPAPNNSITEAGVSYISFIFNVTDLDGADNINRSSAIGSFNKTNEDTRTNLSCLNVSEIGNTITFNCSIGVWYWDANGNWTINASVKDNSDSYVENTTVEMELLLTTGMVMAPTALEWGTLYSGDLNNLSITNPIVVNNTGNKDITSGNVRVTSYNLTGEEQSAYVIPAINFSVNVNNACEGTAMVEDSAEGIASSILSAGNLSNGEAQEELYFCLEEVPLGLIAQAYSTLVDWIIDII